MLRALRSGITLGDAWGSLGNTGDQVRCQGKWGDLKGKHPRFLLDSGVGGLEYLGSGALQANGRISGFRVLEGWAWDSPSPPQLLLCSYKKRFFQGVGHLARGPGGWEEDAARPQLPPARGGPTDTVFALCSALPRHFPVSRRRARSRRRPGRLPCSGSPRAGRRPRKRSGGGAAWAETRCQSSHYRLSSRTGVRLTHLGPPNLHSPPPLSG